MWKQRRFGRPFKQGAVGQTRQAGVSCVKVDSELGIGVYLLTFWKREMESVPHKMFQGAGVPRDEDASVEPDTP